MKNQKRNFKNPVVCFFIKKSGIEGIKLKAEKLVDFTHIFSMRVANHRKNYFTHHLLASSTRLEEEKIKRVLFIFH